MAEKTPLWSVTVTTWSDGSCDAKTDTTTEISRWRIGRMLCQAASQYFNGSDDAVHSSDLIAAEAAEE